MYNPVLVQYLTAGGNAAASQPQQYTVEVPPAANTGAAVAQHGNGTAEPPSVADAHGAHARPTAPLTWSSSAALDPVSVDAGLMRLGTAQDTTTSDVGARESNAPAGQAPGPANYMDWLAGGRTGSSPAPVVAAPLGPPSHGAAGAAAAAMQLLSARNARNGSNVDQRWTASASVGPMVMADSMGRQPCEDAMHDGEGTHGSTAPKPTLGRLSPVISATEGSTSPMASGMVRAGTANVGNGGAGGMGATRNKYPRPLSCLCPQHAHLHRRVSPVPTVTSS